MNLWSSFLAKFRVRKPKPVRTAYGVIDRVIGHEVMAQPLGVTAATIKAGHPDLVAASISAGLRRWERAGKLVKFGDGTYRQPELKQQAAE